MGKSPRAPSVAQNGRLVALLAHDLRNPLSALVSNLDFLASVVPTDKDDLAEVMDDTQAACESLQNMIANLDVLAFYWQGQLGLEQGRMSARQILVEAHRNHLKVAASYRSALEMDPIPPAAQASSLANGTLLVCGLGNLIANSIHYGAGHPVRLGLEVDSDRCRFLVSDHGARIADEMSEDAFSLEGQLVAKTGAGARYGRGFGLFVAAATARALEGTLESVDWEGGNRFVFQVPCGSLPHSRPSPRSGCP